MVIASGDGALIERTGLLARLVDAPVVVLAAPAGHGISTLALQIATRQPGPTAAVRCHDADALGGLAARLLAALTEVFPVLDESTPVADTTGTARLAYALDVVAGPATIVLDDLQLSDPAAANAVLDAVVRHAAADIAIVVATHGELPPALARALAVRGGELLDAADLLFDRDECARLVERLGGRVDADTLLTTSGGWPLAATALARGGERLTPALGAELITALGPSAQIQLAALALVSSVPTSVVASGPAGDELLTFATNHPAAIDVTGERFAVRALARAGNTAVPDVAATIGLADRLERHGDQATALIVLSRVGSAVDALQDRLDTIGPSMLDSGRFRLLHEVIGRIPAHERRIGTLVLDASARLGLQQLEALSDDQTISDHVVAALLERSDIDDDLRLALVGLRVDVLRRNGDPALVGVALEGLAPLGSVGPDTDLAQLVHGRSGLARRGLHLLLYGLGAAALFSGDAAMVAEGRRLQELALAVAERSGIDTTALRGQLVYEHVTVGIARPSAAIRPLEASLAALRGRGHPEAANHFAQLADVHIRLSAGDEAAAAADAGLDWADRTGNVLAVPSLRLVAAGADLVRLGPNATVDAALTSAWDAFIAARRMRRIAPGAAARFANVMLDHDDVPRAEVWIDRAQALIAERLQSGYQGEFLDVTRRRALGLQRSDLGPTPELVDHFTAQPCGAAEYAATVAWDRARRGDSSLVATVVERYGDDLDPPWPTRLAITTADDRSSAPSGIDVLIRVLTPEVRLERNGRPAAPPTGHSARLLVRLVVHDGVLSTEAAIEDLWPDAAIASARNRFHQVLHRTRRALGTDADGLLSVTDGILRLDLSRCSSDVHELKMLAGTDLAAPDARHRAVALLHGVESSLCTTQFGFDEALDDDRWDLDRRIVELAVALLEANSADTESRSAVWALWDRLPDQWALGEALERTGVAAGLDREASRARNRLAGD